MSMISILIPVYNYSIVNLVNEIHTQLIDSKIAFEIICIEDGSDTINANPNSSIEDLSFTTLIVSEVNNGRIKSRQLLCNKAKYEWLLFLDADVMPKSKNFILEYTKALSLSYDAIYGGFAYHETPPKDDYILRWKYGKNHEQVPASVRNKKPYKVVISANFAIKKEIFNAINSKIEHKGYGFDNFFGALLKMHHIHVFHIDNEVYHLGIEKSSLYLNKKEKAAETLIRLVKEGRIEAHDNNLLSLFITLKRLGLNYLFAYIFKLFKSMIRKNLLSRNPSIPLLQLYRISFMCFKDLN